jgi:hypothetical protein
MERSRPQVNYTRYMSGQAIGHYESFFQRANDPVRPRAFWIRYTIFSPQDHPENAVGELWAVFFDGERQQHVAVKQQFPFQACTFKSDDFWVKVGDSRLDASGLVGSAAAAGDTISWDLAFSGASEPLLLLPPQLYEAKIPRAKSLVGLPMATYNGSLSVAGESIAVVDWLGSQNHNWGSKHTDYYAWGQVAGFDNAPDSFLEVATARLKLGPVWTPFMTPLVLRHQGEEIALNSVLQTIRAQASLDYFHWTFKSETARVRVEGTLSALREAFVGLRYDNPPGGVKYCLNSKIAACELTLVRKQAGQSSPAERLVCKQRAAFEILTDDTRHGIEMRTD